jgi:solute carrier family 25 S-adenosylmethionine transporter 26
VPIEVVKQRQQAALEKLSPLLICKRAIEVEGYVGLYRGFITTVLREIPFVLIQFPMWEWLKAQWYYAKKENLSVIEVAVCGSISGNLSDVVCIVNPLLTFLNFKCSLVVEST